jgi:hypothetical protein
MRARLLVLALLVSAAPLLGWSCDRGTLTLHVLRSPDSDEDPLPDPDEALAAGREPEVAFLRVRVEGGGMGFVERTFPYSGRGGRALVPEIPVGSRRVVTVEGLDQKGSLYSRGASIPLEVRPGNNFLKLYVGRVDRFSRTPVDMRQARAFHAAVVLADSHVVLVGGATAITRSVDEPLAVHGALATTEVLDASSASFDTTTLDCGMAMARDCLHTGRALATATTVAEGVLVAGGENDDGPLGEPELLDPGRRLFVSGGAMTWPRSRHATAAVGTGAALFGGRGEDGPIGETDVFAGGRFTASAAISPRESATATVFVDPNGGVPKVLVVGGRDASGEVATAEIYDGSSVWPVGWLTQARAFHTATLLADGRVLILGGLAGGAAVDLAEVFDPETGTFAPVEATLLDRWAHATVAMADGRVLVTGGFGGGAFGGARRDVEILDARSLAKGSGPLGGLAVTRLGSIMTTGRAGHSASLLENGLVLLAGGVGAGDVGLATAEVFVPER